MKHSLALREGGLGYIDRFFDDFFAPTGGGNFGYSPPVDLKETENGFRLDFDLPGVLKDDIKIELEDGILKVFGTRTKEVNKENDRGAFYERSFGSFERRFKLPSQVSFEEVTADLKDGVLTVKVPKSESSKPRLVKVN